MDFAPSSRAEELRRELAEFIERLRRPGHARRPEAGRGVRRSALPPPGDGGPEEGSAGARLVEPLHAQRQVRRRAQQPRLRASVRAHGTLAALAGSHQLQRSRHRQHGGPRGVRHAVAGRAVSPTAPRRRDPIVFRDDRTVRRQFRRHQHPESHRARRRPLHRQRAQVVHEWRGVEALHVRHPHGRVGSQWRRPSSPQHGAHPPRHTGRHDRAIDPGVRARPRHGPLRDALRERTHPEGVHPRRRGRRLCRSRKHGSAPVGSITACGRSAWPSLPSSSCASVRRCGSRSASTSPTRA